MTTTRSSSWMAPDTASQETGFAGTRSTGNDNILVKRDSQFKKGGRFGG
ncbi:MAG: hypothetical protein R3C28_33250 [Pirellulaceae bacterium]